MFGRSGLTALHLSRLVSWAGSVAGSLEETLSSFVCVRVSAASF